MTATTAFEKKSITMPRETVQGIRERVGAREFSSYVSEAAAQRLRRDALAESIARREAEQGPVGDDEVADLMRWLAE